MTEPTKGLSSPATGPLPEQLLSTPDELFAATGLRVPEGRNWVVKMVRLGEVHRNPDVMAIRYLSTSERAAFKGFEVGKRQLEWLGGRIAAKEALRAYDAGRGFDALPPPAVEIKALPSRQPTVGGRPDVSISIAHAGAFAAAVIADARDGEVGIDIELIDEGRDAALWDVALAPREKQKVPLWADLLGEGELEVKHRLWTLKEAAAKALGVGLSIGFHDIQIAELLFGEPTSFLLAGEIGQKVTRGSLVGYSALGNAYAGALAKFVA